jgi:hypothetical protein
VFLREADLDKGGVAVRRVARVGGERRAERAGRARRGAALALALAAADALEDGREEGRRHEEGRDLLRGELRLEVDDAAPLARRGRGGSRGSGARRRGIRRRARARAAPRDAHHPGARRREAVVLARER